MKVGVIGYGHLANVATICLASKGHQIVQWDADPWLLRADQPSGLTEPGAADLATPPKVILIAHGASQLVNCEIVWICYDTPLTALGAGDDAAVVKRVGLVREHLRPRTLVLFSSQCAIGTTAALQRLYPELYFAAVPENIRVGKAIDDFLHQPRIVVGVPDETRNDEIEALLFGLTPSIEYMSPESAEMSKHALNAFLALQITFINEIDRLCQAHGADAVDVSRALLTEARISPQAPLKPGKPFGGGSLQRDVMTLNELSRSAGLHTPILKAIIPSN